MRPPPAQAAAARAHDGGAARRATLKNSGDLKQARRKNAVNHRHKLRERALTRGRRWERRLQRRERDSNPRYALTAYNDLANRRLKPLGHLSVGSPVIGAGRPPALSDAAQEVRLLPQVPSRLAEAPGVCEARPPPSLLGPRDYSPADGCEGPGSLGRGARFGSPSPRYAWPVGMNRILRDQSGAGVIEYALIVALVAVVACAALALLGQRVGVLQNRSSTALPG